MQRKPPITDSPWFWVLLFSGMALVALVAMGPKYGGRQSRIELQYQARERIAAERAAANISDDSARREEQGGRREFASPNETLIPLWPLGVLLALVMVVAAIMLSRRPTTAARRCPRPGSRE